MQVHQNSCHRKERINKSKVQLSVAMHTFFKTEEVKSGRDEHEEREWQLVNDHIENFNRHRLERLSPSERLCVDEIFSRW